MAGNKRPSFLKRQKELQRVAKATQKREERRQRKRSPGGEFGDLNDLGLDFAPNEDGDDMAGVDEPADESDSAEKV